MILSLVKMSDSGPDIKSVYDALEESYMEITKKYISINESNFQDKMVRHPSIFAFFGGILAYAKKEVERVDTLFETREAEIREERREELSSSGKKVTDRALDAYLRTVPELQTLKQGVIRKSYKFNLAKNILSSLEHQKDIIIQLSANRRAEAKLIEQL